MNAAPGIGQDDPTGWPEGIVSHAAGAPDDGGWVVAEVWESQAAHGRFMETRLGDALGQMELPLPSRVPWVDLSPTCGSDRRGGSGRVRLSDPMAMANAMMAMRGQAEAWIASTREALAAAGHGFTADDDAAIAASKAAHPYPEGHGPGTAASPDEVAAAREVARQAMTAVYPPNGLDPSDPRLAPVEGVTLALAAIGAKAIGWSTDEADIERVVAALGVDRQVWERATAALRARVAGDVVLGAFYGQLYSMA